MLNTLGAGARGADSMLIFKKKLDKYIKGNKILRRTVEWNKLNSLRELAHLSKQNQPLCSISL